MVYSLTCTVSKTVGGLINSPSATWTDVSTGMAVTNGNGITVSTVIDDETAISTLTFNPLITSYGKTYNCSGSVDSVIHSSALFASVLRRVYIQGEMIIVLHVLDSNNSNFPKKEEVYTQWFLFLEKVL